MPPYAAAFPEKSNALKAILFLAVLTGSLVAMSRLSTLINTDLPLQVLAILFIFLLAIINACLILGMAVLAHEAVHTVLFRSRRLNDLIGGLLSAMSLIPFHANRQFHLSHHRYSHQPGLDPECTMHARGYIYAFFAGPHIGIFLQHKKFIENLFHGLRKPRYLRLFFKDSCYLSCALAYYFSLVHFADVSPLYALLPTALMFTIVFSVRAMSDHFGLPPLQRKSERFDEVVDQSELEKAGYEHERASGWVVLTHPFIEWLWSNVNYHDVHHRFPNIPHANLKDVFERTRDEYRYAIVPGYFANLKNLYGKKYFR
ncbi:MAG: fatty acid desaturase [Spongiibacteraceae bacterium]